MATPIRYPAEPVDDVTEVGDRVTRPDEDVDDADRAESDHRQGESRDEPQQPLQPRLERGERAAGRQGSGRRRGRCRDQDDDVLGEAEEAEDLDPLTPHTVFEGRGRDCPGPVDDGGGDRQLGEREQPPDLGEQTGPVLALAVRHRTRFTTRRTGGA